MNKKVWIGIIALVGIAIVGILVSVIRNQNKVDFKIGATLPLSGDAAAWGKNTQEGINLAVEEINASGGIFGRNIAVIYEDTQALPRKELMLTESLCPSMLSPQSLMIVLAE